MAKWTNQLSFVAPCQCFTSLGIVTTSPSLSNWAGFPSS
ncbi:cupin protein [Listeria monocytogenes]|nr:cupin protein [Listeria monocytogenes]